MNLRVRSASITILLLSTIAATATMALADPSQRDPLRSLKRAITEANATALTTDQETQLNTLITNYKNALPDGSDDALEAARTAFNTAVLAGDLTTAKAQAAIIATRTAELTNSKLGAEAVFEIGALAVLKIGGQLDALAQKFGNDRLLELVDSLIGRSFGGGGRHSG